MRGGCAPRVPFDVPAATLTEVDLVICVDTVLAHLAGAVGRPVWLLLSTALSGSMPPAGSMPPSPPTGSL